MLYNEGFNFQYIEGIKNLINNFRKEFPSLTDLYCVEDNIKEINSFGIEVINAPRHTQSDLLYVIGDYVILGDVF